MPNSLVSQLTIPNSGGTGSTTYDIKDAQARTDISTLYTLIEGGVEFIGVIAPSPAHQIFDGDTTNPVTIKDGASTKSVTASAGDIVFQDTNEFIWDGSAWRAFGEATGLKSFAFADTGSTSYTPAGSVSQPSFTGSSSSVTITATDNTSGNYQPKGTVSQPTFAGTKVKISGTVTPSGTVSQPEFTGTGVRLVTGNIAVPKTYTTTTASTENKTATVSAAESGDATYTPGGSCSGTAVTLNTTTVNSITAVGSLPSATYTAATENLAFSWGSLPTKGSAQTVATTVKTVTDPSFSGTAVRLVTGNIAVPKTYTTTTATTENKTATVSSTTGTATYTPGGSVSQPTFSGDSNNVSISVAADANGNYTPGGTVSQPTFTGTKAQLSGTTTAAGTVSKPSFTGTAATITVTPDTP